MNTKLINLLLLIFLSSCLTNQPGQVTVEEKSFNVIDVKSSKTSSKSSKTNIKKDWSLPVDASILKNYSEKDGHFGLTYNNSSGQEVRAVSKR